MDAYISITSLLSINVDRQLAENAATSYTIPIQISVIFSPISPNNHGNRGDGLVPQITWEYSPKVGYSSSRWLVRFAIKSGKNRASQIKNIKVFLELN